MVFSKIKARLLFMTILVCLLSTLLIYCFLLNHEIQIENARDTWLSADTSGTIWVESDRQQEEVHVSHPAPLHWMHCLYCGINLIVGVLGICGAFWMYRWKKGSHSETHPETTLSENGLDQIVRSLYLAVEMKDSYTAGHTERVAQYALAIYDQMDESQKRMLPRDDLRYAGLLHDIGKVAIPDLILQKEGKLTPEEYEIVKLHPTTGADMVEQIESLAHISRGIRYHHERWDGRGYPHQLKGEQIPLMGRILAVADTFDAMISTRSYRQAVSAQTAYEEVLRCSHTQFDPQIVEYFKKAYEKGALQVKKPDFE